MKTYNEIVKIAFIIIAVISSVPFSFAGDIVTLHSDQVFEGKVTKIKDCVITFRMAGDKFLIPATDIHTIQFEDHQDKVYRRYLERMEIDPSKCVNARLDAANYHGKKSGHIAMGFLFGPFALLGTAMSDPTPDKGQLTYEMSEHPELLTDPDYLTCYKKKAKGKLIGAESIGFGIALLMVLMITPTYLASK